MERPVWVEGRRERKAIPASLLSSSSSFLHTAKQREGGRRGLLAASMPLSFPLFRVPLFVSLFSRRPPSFPPSSPNPRTLGRRRWGKGENNGAHFLKKEMEEFAGGPKFFYIIFFSFFDHRLFPSVRPSVRLFSFPGSEPKVSKRNATLGWSSSSSSSFFSLSTPSKSPPPPPPPPSLPRKKEEGKGDAFRMRG